MSEPRDLEIILDPPMRVVSEEDYQCGLAEDRMYADPRDPSPYRDDTDPDGWPAWSKSGTAHRRPRPGRP